MIITFGGQPVCCARQARDELASFGTTPPPAFARANSIFNPLGQSPARGWLLLTRASLDALDLNALHNLTITDDLAIGGNPQTPSLTWKSLCFTREPEDLFPSTTSGDPNALFLCEVADARWRVSNPYYRTGLIASYNVRAPNYSNSYYDDTLNGGSGGVAWTWTAMLTNMWANLASSLGTFPGFAVLPDGTPEAFVYNGVDCWVAICDILWQRGQAVRWNPATNTYSIVFLGLADAAADAAVAAADRAGLRVNDADFLPLVRGRLPANISIAFKKRQIYQSGVNLFTPGEQAQWFANSLHTITFALGQSGAEPGTTHVIHDDLPAIYDTAGTLTNNGALFTRANALKAIYLNQVSSSGGGRLQKTYAGLLNVNPGGQVRGVAVRQVSNPGGDNDGGLTTDVMRWPFRMPLMDSAGQWVEGSSDSSTLLQAPNVRPGWPQWQQIGVGDMAYWRWGADAPDTFLYNAAGGSEEDGSSIGGPADTISGAPWVNPRTVKLDQIGIYVYVFGDVGAVMRFAIYEAKSGTNLWPGALVLDSGDVVVDPTSPVFPAGFVTKAVNVTLHAGVLYWMFFNCKAGATAYPAPPTVAALDDVDAMPVLGYVPGFPAQWSSLAVPFAYAAYPATFPAYNVSYLRSNDRFFGFPEIVVHIANEV